MSPRTPQQLEKIRKGRKQSIMDTALEEFASHGYEGTSISMIAKRAGVSKGLLYNYFSGKEELLSAVITDGIQEMIALVDPDHDGILTKEEFDFLIDGMFKLMKDRNSFYRLYFSVVMQPSVSKLFMEKLNRVIEPFVQLMVEYYQKKGAENPLNEAILVGAMLDGIGFNYAFNPGVYPLDEVVKMIKERFI